MQAQSNAAPAAGGNASAGFHSDTPSNDSMANAFHDANDPPVAQNDAHADAQQKTSNAEDGASAPKKDDMVWFEKSNKGRVAPVSRVDAHGNPTVILYKNGPDPLPHAKTLCLADKGRKGKSWGLLSEHEMKNRVYYQKTEYAFVESCEDGKTATIEMNGKNAPVPMNKLEVILPDEIKKKNNTTPDTTDPNLLLGANSLDYTLFDFVQYEAELCNEYINSSDTETDDFDYYDTLESGLANNNAPDSDSDDPTDGTVTPGTIDTTGTTVMAGTAIPTRPATDDDIEKNMKWIMHDGSGYVGCAEYKAAEHWTLTAQQAKNFEKWILDIARQSPMVLLPIDPGIFQTLQAKINPQAPSTHTWRGILPGGGVKIVLPAPYVDKVFPRNLIRECKSKPGVPIDCTRVGSAKSASPMEVEDRASASAIAVVVGSHKVQYPQGDKDYCVAFSAASAVHFAGDEKAGKTIALLAPAAIEERKPVVYVQTQCRENLRPMWETVKIKNAAMVDWQSLGDLCPSVVTVVQIKDSTGNIEHCVSIVSGWIFDTNKKHAIKLSKEGLDACCLGGATFAGFQAGFQLIHTKKRGREEM